MEYKPVQKKNSSWTPTTVQKKGKSSAQQGRFSIQPKTNPSSAPSQEIGDYSRASADRLAANAMRGIQAKEQEQAESLTLNFDRLNCREAEGSTVQRQSESVGLSSGFDVAPPTTVPPTPKMGTGFPSVSETQIQRQCADCAFEQQEQAGEAGKDLKEIGIQTKLTIGAPGDPYEQEADQVASQVMSMSAPPDSSASVQRRLEANNPNQIWQRAQSIKPVVQRRIDEQVQMRELVQRAVQMGGNQASGDLESRLNASKGGGSPLSDDVIRFMEPRFGADFSGVRVHTGGEAVQMNRELGAQAFTHGSDVYFGALKEPGNNELMAHELTHVVQQTGVVQRQNQKPQKPAINLKEVPILEGIAPKSDVLSHLQSLGGTTGHDSSVYRKEILQFQRENSADKIVASQQQVLEEPKAVDIQKKDNSHTLRRCISGCTPQTTFKKGEILGVSSGNKEGWVVGLIGNNQRSFPDALKVEYQEQKGERDYFTILEGPWEERKASLKPGYLGLTNWGGAVAVTFNEKTGILDYGGGTARATIDTNPNDPSAPKIALDREYPLRLPDHPHAGGDNYGNYAKTWFRIEGGPQGDEYLHRGDVSWGCVSVTDNSWPSIYKHLINKRSSTQHIGTIKRINH